MEAAQSGLFSVRAPLSPMRVSSANSCGMGILPMPQNIFDAAFSSQMPPRFHAIPFRGRSRDQRASSAVFGFSGPKRSLSASAENRPAARSLRIAVARAFFCPTRTTSCLPRVTPV